MRSHLDKQVRELVSASAHVYKSFHADGFNILKMGRVRILQSFKDKAIYPRFIFNERKVDFWVAFSPDPDLAKEYDIKRDMASQRLIAEALTGEEVEKLKPREKRWKEIMDLHYEEVKMMKGKGISIAKMMIECDLSERHIKKLLAKIRQDEKKSGEM
jgi:hypothetical protein